MKNYKVRMLVITNDRGGIVGTHVVGAQHEGHGKGVSARLVAGPGQHLHEIEIEVPDKLLAGQDIDSLHTLVHQHIARTKPSL